MVAISIPIAILIITIGALKGSIIKTTYFPIIERRNVDVTLEMPAGTPDTIVDNLLATMEKKVWQVNDIYKKEYPEKGDLILAISRRIGPGTERDCAAHLVGQRTRSQSYRPQNSRDNGGHGRYGGSAVHRRWPPGWLCR